MGSMTRQRGRKHQKRREVENGHQSRNKAARDDMIVAGDAVHTRTSCARWIAITPTESGTVEVGRSYTLMSLWSGTVSIS
jgi:hypothetical protein